MIELTEKTGLFAGIIEEMDDFTGLLNAQLAERGWSISEFARRSGMSQSTASDVINGKVPPSARVIYMTADAFNEPREKWLRIAGHLPPQPPAQDDEQQVVNAYRDLEPEERDVIKRALLGLVNGRTNHPARGPPTEERTQRGERNDAILSLDDPIRAVLEGYVEIRREQDELDRRLDTLLRTALDALREQYPDSQDDGSPDSAASRAREILSRNRVPETTSSACSS
jgi:transcriptional regulator with XRE-family HTH domain